MKILIATLGLLMFEAASAADQPSLLLYINAKEYSHETNIGMKPYFSRWVARGPAVEAAALKTLTPHFKTVGVCENTQAADVIAWISPKLNYNPAPGRYYAGVKVHFYLGDGRLLGSVQATGEHDAPINSVFVDNDVRLAYEDAMQKIVTKFTADATLQQAMQTGLQTDFTRMPCAMVGVLSNR